MDDKNLQIESFRPLSAIGFADDKQWLAQCSEYKTGSKSLCGGGKNQGPHLPEFEASEPTIEMTFSTLVGRVERSK